MEPVARQLLGDPNPAHSDARVLRWGTNGSLAVDRAKGVYFDHEAQGGGGVLAFIAWRQQIDRVRAGEWLDGNYPVANGHDPSGHIVKTYDYVDASGRLLFQVCRKHPKAFLQRRPDPAGQDGWTWSTKGVTPVPYRLPELIADIAAGKTIYIVEGEKDVDNLRAGGLAATCNAGGAGKWSSALNPYFKNANAVAVADNDDAGRAHARTVASAIGPVASRVRILDVAQYWEACPPKGDASDYLDAGHSTADLEALAEGLEAPAAPVILGALFTADQLEGIPVPPRLWHVQDLIPARTVTMLGGDGGVGKSTLAMQLAIATAAEQSWIGCQVCSGRALYLSAEDDRDELHRRVNMISLHYGLAWERLAGLILWSLAEQDAVLVNGSPGQPLTGTDRWAELGAIVARERPTLVVLDSLADVYGGNENDRGQVRSFVRLLRGLVAPINASLILLAHPSLSGLSSGSGLSGSTAWNNSVRSRLYLETPKSEDGEPANRDLRTLSVKKANYSAAGGELRLRWAGGSFVNEDEGPGATGLDQQLTADRIDLQFMFILDQLTAQGRRVSSQAGPTYAPQKFAANPNASGTSSKAFAAAMERLFAKGWITNEETGSASKRRSRLIRKMPAHDIPDDSE
jgi:RecA-family ATPase